MTTPAVDVEDLERRVKDVYREVALAPEHTYHFEMGRPLAERLCYPPDLLDQIPAAALKSFAGVGYYLDLAAPQTGDRVLDLGSGSGTDSFALAYLVGANGHVTGVDMTDEQLAPLRGVRRRPQCQAPGTTAPAVPSPSRGRSGHQARHAVHVLQLWMPVRGMRRCTGRVESESAVQGSAALIPRHEWPGRIVLAVGLVTSSVCVVLLIILLVG